MIQRIQSIFLVLAAIAMLLVWAGPSPLASVAGATSAVEGSMLSDGTFIVQDHIITLIISIVSGVFFLVALFLFKNRPRQILFTRLAIILCILFLVLSAILFYQEFGAMPAGSELVIEYGVLFPALTIILGFLAMRFIQKDDKLVKSADRLR